MSDRATGHVHRRDRTSRESAERLCSKRQHCLWREMAEPVKEVQVNRGDSDGWWNITFGGDRSTTVILVLVLPECIPLKMVQPFIGLG